jgi:hypothetical protein
VRADVVRLGHQPAGRDHAAHAVAPSTALRAGFPS